MGRTGEFQDRFRVLQCTGNSRLTTSSLATVQNCNGLEKGDPGSKFQQENPPFVVAVQTSGAWATKLHVCLFAAVTRLDFAMGLPKISTYIPFSAKPHHSEQWVHSITVAFLEWRCLLYDWQVHLTTTPKKVIKSGHLMSWNQPVLRPLRLTIIMGSPTYRDFSLASLSKSNNPLQNNFLGNGDFKTLRIIRYNIKIYKVWLKC